MAKLLELESFTVITAEDGSIGINRARSDRPDLIITDINMPNINGIEMIRFLRNQADFSRVPIMAITAYGNGVAAEAIEAGADHAMTKPIEFDSLIEDIKRLLEKARRNGSSLG